MITASDGVMPASPTAQRLAAHKAQSADASTSTLTLDLDAGIAKQYATPQEDPGAPPRRPVPPEREQLSASWLAAQRREENLISKPLRLAASLRVHVSATKPTAFRGTF